MTNLKYVFWDSDNTLVNSSEMHWLKHFETLKKHNIYLDEKFRTDIYTNNGRQNWTWITESLGLDLPVEDYLDQIDGWYFDHIDNIKIRSGINEALDIFDKAGIRQAVVSNGRHRSVMSALDAKQLSGRMEFILTKEDYEGRKPGPEPYLTALRKMEKITGEEISADQCLVVEDDPKGVQSGYAAGMFTIHRKLSEDQDASEQANITVFDADEFLTICRQLASGQ
jgi:HAD superfamily hydrolase (TIGR01509 family)